MELFETDKNFQVSYNDQPLDIEVMRVGNNTMYLATFPDRSRLLVTRAEDYKRKKFWTSIPEGKQELAEVVGALITDHIKRKAENVLF